MTRFELASIVFSTDSDSGITFFTIETAYISRSLFSVVYDSYINTLFIGLFWFTFIFDLNKKSNEA